MCGGGDGGDGGASEMRRQEEERQARIKAATDKVNEIFAPYDDAYFGKGATDYKAYYLPQIEKQYNDAKKSLVLSLNDRGLMQSSQAGQELADLADQYGQETTNVNNGAQDFSRSWQNNVENSRAQLLSQASTGPDSSAMASQAAAMAAAQSKMPSFSPIGDLFSKFTAQAANNAILAQQKATTGVGAPTTQQANSAAQPQKTAFSYSGW